MRNFATPSKFRQHVHTNAHGRNSQGEKPVEDTRSCRYRHIGQPGRIIRSKPLCFPSCIGRCASNISFGGFRVCVKCWCGQMPTSKKKYLSARPATEVWHSRNTPSEPLWRMAKERSVCSWLFAGIYLSVKISASHGPFFFADHPSSRPALIIADHRPRDLGTWQPKQPKNACFLICWVDGRRCQDAWTHFFFSTSTHFCQSMASCLWISIGLDGGKMQGRIWDQFKSQNIPSCKLEISEGLQKNCRSHWQIQPPPAHPPGKVDVRQFCKNDCFLKVQRFHTKGAEAAARCALASTPAGSETGCNRWSMISAHSWAWRTSWWWSRRTKYVSVGGRSARERSSRTGAMWEVLQKLALLLWCSHIITCVLPLFAIHGILPFPDMIWFSW